VSEKLLGKANHSTPGEKSSEEIHCSTLQDKSGRRLINLRPNENQASLELFIATAKNSGKNCSLTY
jgi:hypothetical protein